MVSIVNSKKTAIFLTAEFPRIPKNGLGDPKTILSLKSKPNQDNYYTATPTPHPQNNKWFWLSIEVHSLKLLISSTYIF